MAYENEHYNPKLQYLTGVARDDASYMICKCFYKEGHFCENSDFPKSFFNF